MNFIVKRKKKYHIRTNINCKKTEKFKCETSIIILICQRLGSVEPIQQKMKLP